jgi:glycerophosphoryl diester phosphodiesterase
VSDDLVDQILGDPHHSHCRQDYTARPVRAAAASIVAVAFAALAPQAAAQESWTAYRTLNIAHQGGEAEAPSNTMYAYKRALALGADMLEVDFHSTADERLVVLHDADVDRTTEGTGEVYEMTLAEVQRLDAAHDFVPGEGTETGLPESSYPFRGVRTGDRRPPPGFRRADFRILTLDELLREFPEVPINIEIKGRSDTNVGSFLRNAELLAELLNRVGRSEGVIVASFNDAALDRFHELAPQVDLAPAIVDVATFKLLNLPLGPGMVALQVPITFSGITVTDRDLVHRAHAQGYAVHVWLSNDPENRATYDHLLDLGVDGVMPAEPAAFERALCERGIPRPERANDWPGGSHCNPRASIACDVRAVAARRAARGLRVTLRRDDEFDGPCAGRVRVRDADAKPPRLRAVGRFDFGSMPPRSGGPERLKVLLRLSPAGRGAIRGRTVAVRATARPYDAFASSARLRLRG